MFCKQCGTKNEENYKICNNCGSRNSIAAAPQVQEAAVGKNIKLTKKHALIGLGVLVIVLATVIFVANLNRGELQGTWVFQSRGHTEYPITIEFSGNRFTIQEYLWWSENAQRLGQLITNPSTPWRNVPTNSRESSQHVGTVMLSGRSVPLYRVISHRGTYSVSGDILELVFSDGSIETFTIQRTENTLQIRNGRFILR